MIYYNIKLASFVDVLNSIKDTFVSLFNLIKTFITTIINTIPLILNLFSQVIVYNNTVRLYCSVLTPFVLVFELAMVIGIIRSVL